MLRKLLSHSTLYGIAPQLPQVANVFILPIITQDLTAVDYGVAGVVYAYLAAFSSFQFLALQMILSNGFFHYKMQHKWLWRQMHGFLSLWSVIYALFMTLLLYFIIPDEASENRILIIILHIVPILFFNVSIEYGRLYHQISQKPAPIALQVAVVGTIVVCCNLYLISYEKMGYMGWFWSRFIGACCSFIFFFYPVYIKHKFHPIFNFKWRLIKQKLRVALPMLPHFYGAYLLSASDRVVLDILQINLKRIGIYNLAGNFGNYFSSFTDGSGMAVSPVLLQYYRNLSREKAFKMARRLIFIWQAFILLFSFLICLWFKEIFEFLIRNEELHEAYALAIIIIMAYNYRPLYAGFASKLIYFEKADNLWKISFGTGVLNIILNFIFIPIYGIAAAAATTFLTFLMMTVLGFYLKEYKKMKDLNYYPFYWLAMTCLLTFLAFLFKDIFWGNKMLISLMLVGGAAYYAWKNRELLASFSKIQEEVVKNNGNK